MGRSGGYEIKEVNLARVNLVCACKAGLDQTILMTIILELDEGVRNRSGSNSMNHSSLLPVLAARGGFGGIVRWFIQIVIYDICVTTISEVLGVSRLVAFFIFLGILLLISFVGYMMRKKMSSSADGDF